MKEIKFTRKSILTVFFMVVFGMSAFAAGSAPKTTETKTSDSAKKVERRATSKQEEEASIYDELTTVKGKVNYKTKKGVTMVFFSTKSGKMFLLTVNKNAPKDKLLTMDQLKELKDAKNDVVLTGYMDYECGIFTVVNIGAIPLEGELPQGYAK